jgi:aromatic ring hydroxylase
MALKSLEQHRESLRDGREVYFDGQRIEDVTTHPILGVAMAHAAIDYQLAEDPEHRDLATYLDPETKVVHSRYFKLPQGTDDLLKRRELIAAGTRAGKGVVPLIKEIGTDALFALHIVADHMDKNIGTACLPKVRRYYAACRDQDLGFAVAQTDVKGDRSKRPSDQAHPDYYVRVVERRDDGIVVRGAKAHTTATPFANELIVLPTRAVGETDADYAVSFAIPVNAPGLKLIAAVSSHALNNFDSPVSSQHKMVDTVTIFDDVFIPWERVFLCGEWRYAGALANTFVEFHRFTAASYKLPMCELFIGAAALIAEYNGIGRATHISDKLMELIAWTETTRGLLLAAALEHKVVPPGIAVPNITLTNIAKHHFAHNYHRMVQNLQDIAGGLLATTPPRSNWDNETTGPYLDHYLGGVAGVSGEKRIRAMNLIRDIAASEFGGYQEILSIHAEGSLAAQRITILRDYDVERCLALAKKAAHIED